LQTYGYIPILEIEWDCRSDIAQMSDQSESRTNLAQGFERCYGKIPLRLWWVRSGIKKHPC